MKKSILKLLIIITITSLILFSFAGCKSPDTSELEERIEKLELEKTIEELEEELAKKEAEESSPEEEEEEPPEVATDTEQMEEEEDGGEEPGDADVDIEPPTISLTIYEGPTLDGSTCYYRVEATVTGGPTVSFSKDDSGGAWGSKKVQINLNNPTDTYTLTATATNSEGSASGSITLSWGCAIPTPDPIETDVDIGIDLSESGFVVLGGTPNYGAPLAYLGDWDNDKRVLTFLSFDISSISALDDVNIKDVSITIPVVGKVNQPEDASSKIIVEMSGGYTETLYTSPSLNNLNFSGSNLENGLQNTVDADQPFFGLMIAFEDVLANGIKDYYRIHAYSVVLHVKYEVPG